VAAAAAPPAARDRGAVSEPSTNGAPPPSYVGLATRTLAFGADAAIITVVAWFTGAIVALCLSLIGVPGEIKTLIAAIGTVLTLLATIGYFTFFWSASGETPGNRLLGIRVVGATSGRPLSGRRAFLRVFALVLSALLLCVGFLMILVDSRRRALHDRLVGSLVVDARQPRVVRTPGARTLRQARPAGAEPVREIAST
jgi:uncharacterized RDD family membrane protein YckC